MRAFHLSEDVDFALSVLRSLGGELGLVATIVASPFFAIAMVGYGVLHLVFVGEPRQKTRHHAWIYIGWAIFGICAISIIGSISFGMVQVAIQKQVSKRDEEIQNRALGEQTFWHLTDIQKTALGVELDKVPEAERFELQIHCSPNTNSRTFTDDIIQVFTAHSWKVVGNCLFNNMKAGLLGAYVVIQKDASAQAPKQWPPNARILASILGAANIEAQWGVDNTLTKTDFYFAVGDAPVQ